MDVALATTIAREFALIGDIVSAQAYGIACFHHRLIQKTINVKQDKHNIYHYKLRI